MQKKNPEDLWLAFYLKLEGGQSACWKMLLGFEFADIAGTTALAHKNLYTTPAWSPGG